MALALFFAHLFAAAAIGAAVAKRTRPWLGALAGLAAWAGLIFVVIAGRQWWPGLAALLDTLYG